jgi:hypothetical protein
MGNFNVNSPYYVAAEHVERYFILMYRQCVGRTDERTYRGLYAWAAGMHSTLKIKAVTMAFLSGPCIFLTVLHKTYLLLYGCHIHIADLNTHSCIGHTFLFSLNSNHFK